MCDVVCRCVYFALKAVYLMANPSGKKIKLVKIELIAMFAFMLLTWAACGVAIHLLDRMCVALRLTL